MDTTRRFIFFILPSGELENWREELIKIIEARADELGYKYVPADLPEGYVYNADEDCPPFIVFDRYEATATSYWQLPTTMESFEGAICGSFDALFRNDDIDYLPI